MYTCVQCQKPLGWSGDHETFEGVFYAEYSCRDCQLFVTITPYDEDEEE